MDTCLMMPQGATLMVVLLSGTSKTSILISKFCQLLVQWTSSFSGIYSCYSVYHTFSGGGQVSQSSVQLKILCYLYGGLVLKILNVTPRALL